MNRRERTLSPLPTCTRRLHPRAPYRNRSLLEWRDPDQISKEPDLIPKMASHRVINGTTSDDDHSEGRDGAFVADSFNALFDGESGGNREPIDTRQVELHHVSPVIGHDADIDLVGGQSNQEKAVPRRSRRRNLARLFAKSSNSDTAVYDVESLEGRDGEYVRSASLPPTSRLSWYQSDVASGQSEESVGRNSLSAFLSFKKKQASLTAALEAFDGKRASTDHHSCVSSVTMTEDKDGDGDKSTVHTAIPCADHRSDHINPVGTVDLDDFVSEQRQSPEPFQTSTTITQVCSVSPDQELLAPGLGTSDCALSLLHRLRVLSEYTLCTSAAAVAACDTPTTTLIRYYKSMPGKTNSSLFARQVSGCSTDLKPDDSTDSETSLETLSVDVDELQTSTSDMDPEANCTDVGIGVEVANGENGVIDVGVEFDVQKNTIEQVQAIHDALLDSERHCQTDPLLERASSPRTDILNQHGWSQHHRYARHRQASSESLLVLPLNHLSRALVVNGGGRRVNGLHHGLVKSSSAKDLTELRALTDELCELRNWRILAIKTLGAAREELRALESLRATRASALDEAEKLRREVDDLRKENTLLTAMLNDSKRPQNNVTTKDTLVASGKISTTESENIAPTPTKITDKIEAEKGGEISVEMVLESDMVSESELGAENGGLLGRDSVVAESPKQSIVNEVNHNQSILQYESTLLIKDDEIYELVTRHASKLESALVASNQAKEAIANELNELKVRHATVEIRLEVEQKARLIGNKKLEAAMRGIRSSQEKLIESESENQEIKDRLERCQLAFKDSASQITALQDQLQHALDCKCHLEHKLKNAEESAEEKHQEVSFLAAFVKRLQDQLQETEESFRRKLIDERGPRLEEIHRLKQKYLLRQRKYPN